MGAFQDLRSDLVLYVVKTFLQKYKQIWFFEYSFCAVEKLLFFSMPNQLLHAVEEPFRYTFRSSLVVQIQLPPPPPPIANHQEHKLKPEYFSHRYC